MKISLITAFLALFIIGCESSVDGWMIRNAASFCKDKDGVDHISHINDSVICSNGTTAKLRLSSSQGEIR